MKVEATSFSQFGDFSFGETESDDSNDSLNLVSLYKDDEVKKTAPPPSESCQSIDDDGQNVPMPQEQIYEGGKGGKGGSDSGLRQNPVRNNDITVPDLNQLPIEQFRALTAEQLRNSNPRFLELLETQRLRALSPEQLNGLLSSRFGYRYDYDPAMEGVKGRPFGYGTDKGDPGYRSRIETRWAVATALWELKPQQLSQLTDEQVKGLGSHIVEQLSPSQFAGFTSDQLKLLSSQQLKGVGPYGLANLSSEQARSLSADQMSALIPDSKQFIELRRMTAAEIAAMPVAKLSGMNIIELARLTKEQVGALTTEQLRALTREQLQGLSNFSAVDVSKLTVEQMPTFFRFSTEQAQSLNAAQLNALTTAQLEDLVKERLLDLRPEQINAITKEQVDALPKDAWPHKTLTLRKLSIDEVSRVRFPNPMVAWMAFYPEALTPAQIAAVPLETCGFFYGPKLSQAQLSAMTDAQLNVVMKNHRDPTYWNRAQRQILQQRGYLPR